MRRIALALAALLALALPGDAQVNPSNLPANTLVGRLGTGSGPAQAIPLSIINANVLLTTLTGDCTVNGSNVITCTKTSGTALAAPGSATTDTTNASNISSGTLASARFTAVKSVTAQVFTSSGTYTPHAGLISAIVEACGGGGAGGGAATTTGTQVSGGAGGAAGGFTRKTLQAATIGASQVVTIGAGGIATSAMAGGVGGNTTFGALLTANGGQGGTFVGAGTATGGAGGANGGTASGGDINIQGSGGGDVWSPMQSNSVAMVIGGVGGPGYLGIFAQQPTTTPGGSLPGLAGNLCGGGSGAVASGTAGAQAGGAGGGGLVSIIEFNNQ